MFKLAAITVAALAISSGTYAQVQINPSVAACGASTVSNSGVTISATVGQSLVAIVTSSSVTMRGGYWNQVNQCQADFDGNGGVTIDDLFLYFNAYFAGDPRADFNGIGGVTIDDLFLYINAYFVGC